MTSVLLRAGVFCVAAGAALNSSAHLIINEVMQSNIDCIMDNINEFPDSWVELYNAGTVTENLADYSICDKDKPSKAYKFTSGSLNPGEYIIIYCDKEGSGLHTDFRLESGKGGSVYLYKSGEIVDKVENWAKQPAPNIALGRETDGSDVWGYQAVPTPGAANCGEICTDILGAPEFSTPGFVNGQPFDLSLTLPKKAPEGAVIRYTLDGTEPTESSAVYASPIAIDKSTVVRAKVFCKGYLSPRSTTHSYIWHAMDMTIPVVSMVTNGDYFYDEKVGIYVKGSYSPDQFNYEYDWRRPINLEYFDSADAPGRINQLCETRIKGNTTRVYVLKSLAVYANKRFGEKRFNYEFFPDQTPGIEEFKSFEMRNSGNDFDRIYMRDAIIQQCMGMNCDLDWQPSRPAVLYINGEYKGILNIRPRNNEDHVYSYYDGLEDIDMIENLDEVKAGTKDTFDAFEEFYTKDGHTIEEFESLMDTGEFCNLMIMNIFFNNKDFPGNNNIMWRPQAEGGRWRWIAKDTDHGLGLFVTECDYPTLTWITTPGYDHFSQNNERATRLFTKLLAVPEFKTMFIDRCAIYMGDFLSAKAITDRIDAYDDAWHLEFLYFRKKVSPWSYDYVTELERAKEWARDRVPYFYGHLAEFFDLADPVALNISRQEKDGCLTINGIPVKSEEFDGKYFPGRKLSVEFTPADESLEVTGWNLSVTKGGSISMQKIASKTLDIEMPEADNVSITPVLDNSGSVDEIYVGIDYNAPCDIYDLSGRYVGTATPTATPTLAPGIYIYRQGTASTKVIIR